MEIRNTYIRIFIYMPQMLHQNKLFLAVFRKEKNPQLIQLNSQIPQLEPDSYTEDANYSTTRFVSLNILIL